jgi:cohesin loading factor subunit SCC2
VSSLDDVKTNSNIDNNATRSMALDHLGTIAAKMRTASLHGAEDDRLPMMPMSLEEVVFS